MIEATYFDGNGSKQRQIASDLAMGYSTYRRHLGDATKHLVGRLWEREWALRMRTSRAGAGVGGRGSATPATSRARWGIVGKAE